MNQDWAEELKRLVLTYLVPFGGKLVGAIVLWVVGRIVGGAIRGMAKRNLEKRKLDVTLVRYVDSVLGVVFTLLILLAALSIFGVETASFAGVIGACGVAIGLAWSGLLSNFAAGVFMVILRPFKVGDMITAAGVTGVVHEIGLFATTIDTADNIRLFCGNAKIFGDTIYNYTLNPYRRVDLKAQLAASVDPADAAKRLRARLATLPNVMKEPAPSVELIEFTHEGPVLAVRPFCHNDHYWDVYFATNEAIQTEFSAAGYPAPERRMVLRSSVTGATTSIVT